MRAYTIQPALVGMCVRVSAVVNANPKRTNNSCEGGTAATEAVVLMVVVLAVAAMSVSGIIEAKSPMQWTVKFRHGA